MCVRARWSCSHCYGTMPSTAKRIAGTAQQQRISLQFKRNTQKPLRILFSSCVISQYCWNYNNFVCIFERVSFVCIRMFWTRRVMADNNHFGGTENERLWCLAPRTHFGRSGYIHYSLHIGKRSVQSVPLSRTIRKSLTHRFNRVAFNWKIHLIIDQKPRTVYILFEFRSFPLSVRKIWGSSDAHNMHTHQAIKIKRFT